jgi:hypothetical protein
MSDVGKAFLGVLGKPDPATPSGLQFREAHSQQLWQRLYQEIGAGWFLNRFFYLFGPGLERLLACLEAWSFLVPPGRDRMILGHNAYGAILVLERPNTTDASVHLLDPFRVQYWSDPRIGFINLIGRWLPDRMLPGFSDDLLYRAWIQGGTVLPDDVILAPEKPLGLGGTLEPDNIREEEIVSYYRTTGPIYEKAFANPRPGGSGKKKRSGSKRGA